MFWRITAQRLLVETGNKDVAGKLYDLARNHDLDETGNNPSALHALWTLHGLGLMDGSDREALDVAVEALKHPAPGVRKAAIQVLPKTGETRDAVLAAGLSNDADRGGRGRKRVVGGESGTGRVVFCGR